MALPYTRGKAKESKYYKFEGSDSKKFRVARKNIQKVLSLFSSHFASNKCFSCLTTVFISDQTKEKPAYIVTYSLSLFDFLAQVYVSGFEERGHFGPDINFEILICTELVLNQLSFTACFMFIAVWIHFLCVLYKLFWPTAKRENHR